MTRLRLFFTCTALVILSSCVAYTARVQLDALNQAVPSGSPFAQRLTVEYRDLANFDEDKLMSYANAEHFSRKGLKSAKGEIVPPENPSEWSISDDQLSDLLQSRQKLVDLLDNGGREAAPDTAAVAQARYDCWVERAEKSTAIEDASVCHSQYDEAMAQLSVAVDHANNQTSQTQNSSISEESIGSATELQQAMFLVFFDWNKANVTPTGQAVIDTVIEEAQRLGAAQIDIVGHADLSGTNKYNLKLSLHRAEAIKAALVKRGFNAASIHTTGKGDTQPIVPTARGVKEPANRRAEIRFE